MIALVLSLKFWIGVAVGAAIGAAALKRWLKAAETEIKKVQLP